MLSKQDLDKLVKDEERGLGVGSPEFMRRHNEIMEEMDRIQRREQARKEEQARRKQILNVRDVMAVLAVSESKAYGIIKQLNQELAAKGYIVIPGKVSMAYFEEKCYGILIAD